MAKDLMPNPGNDIMQSLGPRATAAGVAEIFLFQNILNEGDQGNSDGYKFCSGTSEILEFPEFCSCNLQYSYVTLMIYCILCSAGDYSVKKLSLVLISS